MLTAYSQNGSSEAFIGEWMEKRNNRNELVIATKVCSGLALTEKA